MASKYEAEVVDEFVRELNWQFCFFAKVTPTAQYSKQFVPHECQLIKSLVLEGSGNVNKRKEMYLQPA